MEPIWLVFNRASGSNDEAALEALERAIADAGFRIAHRTCFPDENAPDASILDAEGIATLCVFAGDGTIHTVVTTLFGWGGRIIVLPGGTMNLLSKKMHGDVHAVEIMGRIGEGKGRSVRPVILKGQHGYALTGTLAGPGTAWNEVREAMREAAIAELASATAGAIAESVSGERVTCRGVAGMHHDGYAAISVAPTPQGAEVRAYYADEPGDYLGQLTALLQRDFRNGPHETFGPFETVTIETLNGDPMGLLMDGEPQDGQASECFAAAKCEVDLVATADGA